MGIADRSRRSIRQPGVVPMALASSMAAVYGCVPETDQIPPAALCVVHRAADRARHLACPADSCGSPVSARLVLVTGLYGATGRQSALIGTLFAAWAFVLLPVIELIRPSTRDTPEPIRWVVAGIGSVGSIAVARTGALEPTAAPAIVAVALAVVATTGLSVAIIEAWSRLR